MSTLGWRTMFKNYSFIFILVIGFQNLYSQDISITGRALNETSQGQSNCDIYLQSKNNITAKTGPNGNFILTGTITSVIENKIHSRSWFKGGLLYVHNPYVQQTVNIIVHDIRGKQLAGPLKKQMESGTHSLSPQSLFKDDRIPSFFILNISFKDYSVSHLISNLNMDNSQKRIEQVPREDPALYRKGKNENIAYDSLVVSCPNLLDTKLPLEAFTENLGNIIIKRPNILFIMTDQHRGDAVGADGADWVTTPNMDMIANEGILFKKAYASIPSCTPARSAVISGMSSWGHGMLGYSSAGVKQELPYEMPKMLSKSGYYTMGIGKHHFENKGSHGYDSLILEEAWRQVNQDDAANCCDYRFWFNSVFPEGNVDTLGLSYVDHRGNKVWPYADSLHASYWTAQQSIDFLNNYQQPKPWFLKISMKRPHPPFDPPQRWMDHYQNTAFPEPHVSQWGSDWHGSAEQPTPVAHTEGTFSTAGIRSSRQAYLAGLSFADEQLGRVFQTLKDLGEYENTIILHTADHGDMMGDHDLWRKTYAYEGSARVPMIIRWGENINALNSAVRGQKLNHLVELRDVLPTFMDIAGIAKVPTTFRGQTVNMEGLNMLELIKDNFSNWRSILDLEHAQIYWTGNAWTALTDGKYKYIYFTTSGRQQLFDLENDPNEMIDLSENNGNDALLAQWRLNMINHLSIRGNAWVSNGDLVVQSTSLQWRPNYGQ